MKQFLLTTTAAVALIAGGIGVNAQTTDAKKEQPSASQPTKGGTDVQNKQTAQEKRGKEGSASDVQQKQGAPSSDRASKSGSSEHQKGAADKQEPRGQAGQQERKKDTTGQAAGDEQKSKAGNATKDRSTDEPKAKSGQASGERVKGDATKAQSDQQKAKQTSGQPQKDQQKSATGAGETKSSTETRSGPSGTTATETKQGTGSTSTDSNQGTTRSQPTTGSTTTTDTKQQQQGGAGSQTPTGPAASGSSTTGSASLSQEQRTRVIQQITTTNVEPVRDVSFSVSVGTTVPERVRYYDLPPTVVEVVPQYRNHKYIVVRDEIVIIEPSSRRIVATLPRSDGRSTTGVGVSRIKISEQDRHVIREIVLKEERVRPIERQIAIEVGGNVPETVELHSFPAIVVEKVPQVKTYSFFVRQDDIVIVDPKEKRVVEVIE